MSLREEIPVEWYNQINPHYFYTYYGDIYSGFVYVHPNYEDGFFIISASNRGAFIELRGIVSIEKCRELGIEIKDKNIIKSYFPSNNGLIGNPDRSKSISKSFEHNWKKMFVFGAGASSNCVFGEPQKKFIESSLCPPLGKDLFHDKFHDIIKNYNGAKLSIPSFESKGNDIEACLEDEWATIRDSHSPNITSRHTNLQFYLSELFQKITNEITSNHYRTNLYSLFATQLHTYLARRKNERIAIVSFNYDTILEHFIQEAFRIQFKTTDDYIDWGSRQVVLFKPHGSCNWGWRFRHIDYLKQNQIYVASKLYENNVEPVKIYYELLGEGADMVYTYSPGLEADTGSSHPINRHSINKDKIEVLDSSQSGYLPALLMPYKDKDEFIMPYNHHHALRFYLGDVEELYLIGWKGNEEAFNRLLNSKAKKLKKIIIVNPNGKEVKENLSKQLKLENYFIEVIDSFEDFVKRDMSAMV